MISLLKQNPLPEGQGRGSAGLVVLISTSLPRGAWINRQRWATWLGDNTSQLRDSAGLRLRGGTGFAFEPSHPGDRAPQPTCFGIVNEPLRFYHIYTAGDRRHSKVMMFLVQVMGITYVQVRVSIEKSSYRFFIFWYNPRQRTSGG